MVMTAARRLTAPTPTTSKSSYLVQPCLQSMDMPLQLHAEGTHKAVQEPSPMSPITAYTPRMIELNIGDRQGR